MVQDQDGSRDERFIELAEQVAELVESGATNATESVLEGISDLDVDDELILSLLYEEIFGRREENGRDIGCRVGQSVSRIEGSNCTPCSSASVACLAR